MKVAFLDTVHPILLDRLNSNGYICEELYNISREEILKGGLEEYTGLVIRSRLTIDARLLASLPSLKWIARSGSGLDNIDVEEAEARGVKVINSPEGNRDAVGEHCLGMLLTILHKIKSGDRSVHEMQWLREEHRGEELGAKTVGIIGYGVMGSAFAEKLSGLGCRVIAYDKYKKGFGSTAVEEVSEEDFFLQSEVVSIHVPWTPETKGMVDADWLRRFEKPIILLNTSRGAVVKTGDLLDAIDSGKVRSAGLDVIEYEGRSLEGLELDEGSQTTLNRLLSNDQILITPHVAGWSVESHYRLSSVIADKILKP
ncbi:MAG: hydroxyacid dehydrogenase [Euryarchaeota archaeon]|nr:hydroxyacid dehydrogenase [Euryarchaeota archaeon]